MENQNSQIVIYKDKNGDIKIDVQFDGDTVWLTQETIATLYAKGRSTITEHIKNVFDEGELDEKVVCREFRHTTPHGAILGKTQEKAVKYYNLELIIAVGYRVKSTQGTAFRKWATARLREYIVKGFVIDSGKQNVGFTSFRGLKPTKEEVVIAKNYYNKEEITQLNALVEQYLIFATEQARRRVPMAMNDWIEKLHGFLTINDRNILHDAGRISHELMKEIAEKKFNEYKQVEAKQDLDFDEVALNALESVKSGGSRK